jgi:CBS domain-containing protein
MLSGMPPGFEARAAEDTLCYRIPVAVARPLLERARSRELASGVREPAHQSVAKLIRSPTVRCHADDTVGETARRMTEAGAGAAIVELPGGELGIMTDRDLRERVVAAGVPSTAAVAIAMTTPVFAVTPDRLGGEVLFELLERGIKHAPIVTESGRLVGVIEDADLFAVQARSWFGARRAIARASDVAALASVAERLPAITLDLHSSNLRALEVARVRSALVDAVTVRALELAAGEHELPADGVVWLALGSHARRELTPASDPSGALVWSDDPPDRGFIEAAGAALAACGLPGQIATRTPAAWQAPVRDPARAAPATERRRPRCAARGAARTRGRVRPADRLPGGGGPLAGRRALRRARYLRGGDGADRADRAVGGGGGRARRRLDDRASPRRGGGRSPRRRRRRDPGRRVRARLRASRRPPHGAARRRCQAR